MGSGDGTCSSSSSGCSGTDGNIPSYALMASPAIALATGVESTCAINQSYSLFCWGGQSGEFDGTSDDILVPYIMSFNNSTLGESVGILRAGSRWRWNTKRSGFEHQ